MAITVTCDERYGLKRRRPVIGGPFVLALTCIGNVHYMHSMNNIEKKKTFQKLNYIYEITIRSGACMCKS